MKLFVKVHAALFLGLIVMSTSSLSNAQSAEGAWELPVNLSQSGAATEPRIAIDAAGQQHVLWLDNLDGVVHSQMTEEGWSEPQRLTDLFSTSVPILIADENGSMHAFWRDEENLLLYSRLTDGDFNNVEAWTPPIQLGISVLTAAVALGEDSRLHVTYIKSIVQVEDEAAPVDDEEDDPVEYPAGVYYLVSDESGESWSEAIPVYNSLYYRVLEEANAHVQITTTGSSVFIVWDDRPNERILRVQSSDGGQTWDDIHQVDGRSTLDDLDAISPSWVKVVANDELVYIQWQAAHGESGCTLYYQWSGNGGVTWESSQRIIEQIPVCGESAEVFFQNDLLFLLVRSSNGAYYLLAWDQGQWSEAEEQVDLLDFINPDTFRPLSLDCLQGVLEGDRFYLVGCDNLDGGDVWVTSRLIGDDSAFFPPESIWREPEPIMNGINASIIGPVSIADPNSGIHVMWSQTESIDDLNLVTAGDSIHYARWDGRLLLGPSTIVTSPTGSAENPMVALDNSGHLLLVWTGSAGDVYFSRAEVAQANAASTWADPVQLPVPRSAVRGADILVDRTGKIHVAFTISLNENRGIYLTESSDDGTTWSEPITAFDGVAAGWGMVDHARLTQTGNGNLYLLWTQSSLPPAQRPLALYFARLVNDDAQWSEPELVAEGPVIWSRVLGVGERTVHRVWQELDNGTAAIWHEFSTDSGLNWSEPALIFPGFDEPLGSVALTSDSFNQLHLLQMTDDTLRHWLWDSERWVSQPQLNLNSQVNLTPARLTAASDTERGLTAIFAGQVSEPVEGELEDAMFFSVRPLEVPETTPEPLSTLTPTPQPTPTVTPTPGPSPTPTVVFSNDANEETGLLSSIITREPLLSGLIPAGLLVFIVLIIGFRFRAYRGRDG